MMSSSVDSKASLLNPLSKAVTGKIRLADMLSESVYKTKPIFTGLEYGKLS